jgi:hypothetical protein
MFDKEYDQAVMTQYQALAVEQSWIDNGVIPDDDEEQEVMQALQTPSYIAWVDGVYYVLSRPIVTKVSHYIDCQFHHI